MVARLSGPSRCYYTHIPSIAARLDGFAFLRSLITVSDPLFCCCIQCRLSGCRVAFVRLGFALLTTLRQPLRALVPDSVPGSQEVSRPSAALSVFAGDTAGVSVCCRVALLLIALFASAFGLDFCSGSSRHSSPTKQALPECDQRYRLMQQAICHVREGLVSGRWILLTAGPGAGGCTAEPMT